jgi:hypothetical protein
VIPSGRFQGSKRCLAAHHRAVATEGRARCVHRAGVIEAVREISQFVGIHQPLGRVVLVVRGELVEDLLMRRRHLQSVGWRVVGHPTARNRAWTVSPHVEAT